MWNHGFQFSYEVTNTCLIMLMGIEITLLQLIIGVVSTLFIMIGALSALFLPLLRKNERSNEQLCEDVKGLDAKLDRSTEQLEKRIDKLDAKLDRSTEQLDAKLDRSTEKLEKRIDKLDAKFDRSTEKLEKKNDDLRDVVHATNTDVSRLSERMLDVETLIEGDKGYQEPLEMPS